MNERLRRTADAGDRTAAEVHNIRIISSNALVNGGQPYTPLRKTVSSAF
jgi:hypothetical protein